MDFMTNQDKEKIDVEKRVKAESQAIIESCRFSAALRLSGLSYLFPGECSDINSEL